MPEFVFVLGKNPELSAAEIMCYLEARNIGFSVADSTEMLLVISAPGIPGKTAQDLGGTLKLGEVLLSSRKKEEIVDSLDSLDWEKITEKLPDKPLGYMTA